MTRAAVKKSGGKGRSRVVSKTPPLPIESLIPSTGYFQRSWLPWPSLVFLLPLMIAYEVGTRLFAIDPVHHVQVRILAFDMIQEFFSFFGVTGQALPALAVVGILLGWHIARNDPWKFKLGVLPRMALESVLLSLPVIVLSAICARQLPLRNGFGTSWASMIVLSIGAGVYEELLFRLIAFTLLAVLMIDLLKVRKVIAGTVIVVVPAILFSLYHYLGPEHFSMQSFVFRTLAGIYFGVIFLCRGFGITAGAHSAYDVLIVLLSRLAVAHG